jgi:signal transduction histidine kinase
VAGEARLDHARRCSRAALPNRSGLAVSYGSVPIEIVERHGAVVTRAGLDGLAEEQAALRRVATLVARGTPPEELFEAVAEEVERVFRVENAGAARYESDGTMTTVAISRGLAASFPVGGRWPLGGKNVSTAVFESGRSVRIDDYGDADGHLGVAMREQGLRSSIGAPIVVEGRLWGVMTVSSTKELLPADTEARLASFTDLVATAISNTEARAQVGRLADEQAALRRVATLVARVVPQEELFGAVTEEVGRLFGTDFAGMIHYEADGAVKAVAAWSAAGPHPPLPDRWPAVEGDAATLIANLRRPVRIDDWSDIPGPIAAFVRDVGISSSVGSPILVDGRLWGALAIHTNQPRQLNADTESRLENFTELVATAISNLQARSELAASRARIVAATDQTRRRFERNLHDGVQQRLVSLTLQMRNLQAMVPPELADLQEALSGLDDEMGGVLDDLREVSRGIHPAILSEGGLGPALRTLALRSPIPVELDVEMARRLGAPVEVAAYYVASEALANAAKHAQASVAEIRVAARDDVLDLTIQDDGVGGADPAGGSGLTGLRDRVEALGGTLTIASPAGAGTSVRAQLPIA